MMFAAAEIIWLGVLVPVQIRQARMTKGLAEGGTTPLSYWRLGRIWIGAGLLATVPLIGAMWLMPRKSW